MGDAGRVQAGKDLELDVAATDPDGDPITSEVLGSSNYIDENKALNTLPRTDLGGGRLKVTAPDRPGVWKLYVKATDGKGNVGVETRSARVVPPAVDGTHVALNKPATASSSQASYGDCPCPASNAVDGNGGVDTLDVTGTGRYVRVNGTERGTGYGYSLYEFGVYS